MATKRIPYGISDFQRLLEDDYYYVDKTRFIEEIEKSPSFNNVDVDDTRKLVKVSSVIGLNSFLVGYAVETMDKAYLPQLILLLIISFALTMVGFHLGKKTSKTIVSKRVELVAGLMLIVMAIKMIII